MKTFWKLIFTCCITQKWNVTAHFLFTQKKTFPSNKNIRKPLETFFGLSLSLAEKNDANLKRNETTRNDMRWGESFAGIFSIEPRWTFFFFSMSFNYFQQHFTNISFRKQHVSVVFSEVKVELVMTVQCISFYQKKKFSLLLCLNKFKQVIISVLHASQTEIKFLQSY